MIQNKGRLFITREDFLLLYKKKKEKIRKSCMVYVLEMGFTLLNKMNQLMILVLIGCEA